MLGAIRLSKRQERVLALIAAGRADKQISQELGISVHTVRSHLERIYRQHGLHSRSEAVAAWLTQGEKTRTNAQSVIDE